MMSAEPSGHAMLLAQRAVPENVVTIGDDPRGARVLHAGRR